MTPHALMLTWIRDQASENIYLAQQHEAASRAAAPKNPLGKRIRPMRPVEMYPSEGGNAAWILSGTVLRHTQSKQASPTYVPVKATTRTGCPIAFAYIL
jgi:hypothetical protein